MYQSALKELTGNAISFVITDDEKEFMVNSKILDVSQLIPSHFIDNLEVVTNSAYPAELQPRDRANRLAMRESALKMAKNIRPADLLSSRNLNQGAPAVRKDNVVLNGNGRVMALLYAYNNGLADNYKQELISQAPQLGFSVNDVMEIENPVLVRVFLNDLSAADLQSVISSNAGGSKFSPTEQAKIDAEKISDEIFGYYVPNDKGDLTTADNQTFLAAVLNAVCTRADLNAYLCNDGRINSTGVIRVKNTLFAAAYNDDSQISLMTESTDNNIKNISSALLNVAPNVAKLVKRMNSGELFQYNLSQAIITAANKISALRDEHTSVASFLSTKTIFAVDEMAPESKVILAVFDANKNSVLKITDFINAVIKNIYAQGSPNQTSLFGSNDPVKFLTLLKISAVDFVLPSILSDIFDTPVVTIKTEDIPATVETEKLPATVETEKLPATVETEKLPATVEIEDIPATVETPKSAESTISQAINSTVPAAIPADSLVESKFSIDNGKLDLAFRIKNSAFVPVSKAYEILQDNGLNFETSYKILLDALLFGKSSTKTPTIGNKKAKWNNIAKNPDKGVFLSQYYGKRNLRTVANAMLTGSKVQSGVWKSFINIDAKKMNEMIEKILSTKTETEKLPATVEIEKLPATVEIEKLPATVETEKLPNNISVPPIAMQLHSTPAPVDVKPIADIKAIKTTPVYVVLSQDQTTEDYADYLPYDKLLIYPEKNGKYSFELSCNCATLEEAYKKFVYAFKRAQHEKSIAPAVVRWLNSKDNKDYPMLTTEKLARCEKYETYLDNNGNEVIRYDEITHEPIINHTQSMIIEDNFDIWRQDTQCFFNYDSQEDFQYIYLHITPDVPLDNIDIQIENAIKGTFLEPTTPNEMDALIHNRFADNVQQIYNLGAILVTSVAEFEEIIHTPFLSDITKYKRIGELLFSIRSCMEIYENPLGTVREATNESFLETFNLKNKIIQALKTTTRPSRFYTVQMFENTFKLFVERLAAFYSDLQQKNDNEGIIARAFRNYTPIDEKPVADIAPVAVPVQNLSLDTVLANSKDEFGEDQELLDECLIVNIPAPAPVLISDVNRENFASDEDFLAAINATPENRSRILANEIISGANRLFHNIKLFYNGTGELAKSAYAVLAADSERIAAQTIFETFYHETEISSIHWDNLQESYDDIERAVKRYVDNLDDLANDKNKITNNATSLDATFKSLDALLTEYPQIIKPLLTATTKDKLFAAIEYLDIADSALDFTPKNPLLDEINRLRSELFGNDNPADNTPDNNGSIIYIKKLFLGAFFCRFFNLFGAGIFWRSTFYRDRFFYTAFNSAQPFNFIWCN